VEVGAESESGELSRIEAERVPDRQPVFRHPPAVSVGIAVGRLERLPPLVRDPQIGALEIGTRRKWPLARQSPSRGWARAPFDSMTRGRAADAPQCGAIAAAGGAAGGDQAPAGRGP
jgi:hypothetical protein